MVPQNSDVIICRLNCVFLFELLQLILFLGDVFGFECTWRVFGRICVFFNKLLVVVDCFNKWVFYMMLVNII